MWGIAAKARDIVRRVRRFSSASTDAIPAQFDPTSYPREYRLSGESKFIASVGICCILGGLTWAAYVIGFGAEQALVRLVGCGILILMGIAVVGQFIKWRLVLSPDSIEVRTLRKRQTMRREEITGVRWRSDRGTSIVCMKSAKSNSAELCFRMLGPIDQEFRAWFSDLQDLDVVEARQQTAEMEQDATLGASVEERRRRIAGAKRFAKATNLIALAVSLWLLVNPKPYGLLVALAASFPWIAIFLCWRFYGLFTLDGRLKHESRGSFASAMIVPGMMIFLRAFIDVPLVAWIDVLFPALVGGGVLTMIAAYVDPSMQMRSWNLAACGILMSFYVAGTVPLANALLDDGLPQIFRVEIQSKRVDRGKPPSHYFAVGPWGPFKETNEVYVGAAYYAEHNIGDSTCVVLHPGALCIPWYWVADCPPATN